MAVIVISVGILVYCLVVLALGQVADRKEKIAKRIEKSTIKLEFEERTFEEIPFFERIIKPTVDSAISSLSTLFPISEKEKAALSTQLLHAGIKTRPVNYATMRMVIIILSGVAGILLFASKSNYALLNVLFYGFLGVYFGYVTVRFSLSKQITTRQKNIENQLPNFLDLLSVCVEAGLGFDQSVVHVIKQFPGELSEEFEMVIRDISLGTPRKIALQHLQERCPIDELKTFSAAVIQADETGISLTNILSVQAANVRVSHKHKVEEKAQRLPIKILIPMTLFIFPVLFIIILGPVVPSILSMFGS